MPATLETPAVIDRAAPAGAAFPAPDWVTLERVPVFKEHENAAGEYYDRDALAAIAANCNRRITATGDYCPLVDGHTPTPEDAAAGAPDPAILGFAGPFYLERSLENGLPIWIITADFHVRQSNLERVRQLPRRSVEIWKAPNLHDRYFDPIALLGATTPKLDLGLVYSRAGHDGACLVERYEAGSPAATNVFIPALETGRRPKAPETYEMALDDTDLQKIVAALDQLDWVQWVKKQMAGETAEADAGTPAEPDLNAMPEGSNEPTGQPPAAGSVDDKERNAKAGDVDQYKAVANQLAGRVETLERELRTTKRGAVIDALAENYQFDPKKAKERAASMNDAQFDAWAADARENYAKIPHGRMTNIETPGPAGVAIEFTPAMRDQAIDLAAREKIPYSAAVDRVKAGKR